MKNIHGNFGPVIYFHVPNLKKRVISNLRIPFLKLNFTDSISVK
jgi:hypothetical protein